MKNVILFSLLFLAYFNLNAQSSVKEVYLKPIKITYLQTVMPLSQKARYYVKVNDTSKGCLGYEGAMHKEATISSFENLSSGEMTIGSYNGDATININFDAWVSKREGSESWIWNSSTDNELADTSIQVALTGTAKKRVIAEGQDFKIEFEVYQKEDTNNNTGGSLPFKM